MMCKIVIILIVTFICALQNAYALPGSSFATNLFYDIAKERPTQNLVVSPMSIQSCLAQAYAAATGSTAAEIQKGLQFADDLTKKQVISYLERLQSKANNDNGARIKIATRLFVDQKYQLADDFTAISETLNFRATSDAARKINNWVTQATNEKIQKLIDSESITVDTVALLTNAIYFTAHWINQFNVDSTFKGNFSVSSTRQVVVDTMHQMDDFYYGEFPELKAKALELRYSASDVSMLILLPDSVDGLAKLEEELTTVDLFELSKRLNEENVAVTLPKFKIEFDLSLKSTLKALGMRTMFTSAADFSKLLVQRQDLSIADVRHSAFIELHEHGTEAAAATLFKIVRPMLPFRTYRFEADHPFFFAIKDDENIYFAGHVVSF